MRMLYIIPTFQHPKVRGPDRHYRFIRELSQRHDITLLTLVRSKISPEAMAEMAGYTEQIFTFAVNGAGNGDAKGHWPFLGASRLAQLGQLRASVAEMKKTFGQLMQRGDYDLLLFHGKDCAAVLDEVKDLPVVIDFCDATSMRVRARMSHVGLAKRLALGARYLQVRQIEQKMIRKTPHVAFISGRDREAILGSSPPLGPLLGGRGKGGVVIPNGLDLQYWRRRSNNPQSNCLIFTGVMNYAPNEDTALYLIDQILPRLKQSLPNLALIIAGRDPTPALLERGRRHPEVTITGFVDDMRDYLEQASVFVAPLRYASGMQNKIQEALAMEIPVVTTSVVAAGFRMGDGQEAPLYMADTPAAFAEKVVSLLGQPAEQARLAREGRQFAEKYFDWSRSARQLEQMCFEAIERISDKANQR
jgi:glycosyltransferase involved in cell wall biosynthesis